MDGDTLETMVKPWWLSPPAFYVAMILAGLACLGVLGIEWYVDRQMQRILTLLGCVHGVQVLGVTVGEPLGLIGPP